MVNQECPSGVSEIVESQGVSSDVQRVIRILTVQETPPNHVNYESTFFSKTVQKPQKT